MIFRQRVLILWLLQNSDVHIRQPGVVSNSHTTLSTLSPSLYLSGCNSTSCHIESWPSVSLIPILHIPSSWDCCQDIEKRIVDKVVLASLVTEGRSEAGSKKRVSKITFERTTKRRLTLSPNWWLHSAAYYIVHCMSQPWDKINQVLARVWLWLHSPSALPITPSETLRAINDDFQIKILSNLSLLIHHVCKSFSFCQSDPNILLPTILTS